MEDMKGREEKERRTVKTVKQKSLEVESKFELV